MNYKFSNCVAARLRRLSRIVDGMIRNDLLEFNVTENQMNILLMLSQVGRIEQGVIGKKLVLERSTVSRGVRLLEKLGYVKRSTDYRPEVELTPNGLVLVGKFKPVWETYMNDINEIIGVEGFKSLEYLESKLL